MISFISCLIYVFNLLDEFLCSSLCKLVPIAHKTKLNRVAIANCRDTTSNTAYPRREVRQTRDLNILLSLSVYDAYTEPLLRSRYHGEYRMIVVSHGERLKRQRLTQQEHKVLHHVVPADRIKLLALSAHALTHLLDSLVEDRRKIFLPKEYSFGRYRVFREL